MRFAYPYVLWLLLVLPPAIALFFWWATRKRQMLMTKFIQARLLPGLTVGLSPARQKVRFACIIAAVAMLILALARPQRGFHFEDVTQRGLDIVVAIDTSKSMLAQDIAPNRLARAKLAALDLMQQAKSDRLGLVAFAGSAFLQCPLTIDETAFRQSVEMLNVSIIPQGGTALAEAINTALGAFKEDDNYRVLVLFTDGEDNDAGALEAARAAAEEGLRIFTVGIGTAEGELLRLTDNKGRTDYVRDAEGNPVKSSLNEKLLREIAAATEGGFYIPLRGAQVIDLLYERGLAPLPKSDQTTRRVRQYHEQYYWFLAAAILLLLTEMILPERRSRSRRVRASETEQNEPSLGAPTVAAIAWLLMLPMTALASSSGALEEYRAGRYDEALQEYQRALQRNTNDARLRFNTGAAAYRKEYFDEAVKQFSEATSAKDLAIQQQAYYNLGNTFYRMGEAVPDREKKIEIWQNALKQYEGAIALNTNDADAEFNYQFVKRKIAELQQEEMQQQQQQQDQNQGEGGEQDQQQQNQQGQQQDKNEQQQQQSGQQEGEQEKDQQQPQQAEKQSDEQKQEQQQQNQQAVQQDEKPEGQQGQQAKAGVQPMTPEEARQLLDAQKGDERFLQFVPPDEPYERRGPVKDW